MQSATDTAALTCAEVEVVEPVITLASEHELYGASPSFLMQSLEWFCCSFVLDTCGAQASSMQMLVDEEVSAFEEETVVA